MIELIEQNLLLKFQLISLIILILFTINFRIKNTVIFCYCAFILQLSRVMLVTKQMMTRYA